MASGPGRSISLEHLSFTRGVQATTQADRLPKVVPDGVPGLPLLLRGRSNFLQWDFEVKQELKLAGLRDLIDLDLPRPATTHEKYAAWHNYSRGLQSWLVGQLSGGLTREFRLTSDAKDYADDAYRTIRKIALGHGVVACQSLVYSLVKRSRKDYSTAGQYVEDFENNYTFAKELDCGLSPFVASLLLLRELYPEFTSWVMTEESAIPGDAGKTYTDNDFFRLCRRAIKECERNRYE
ncbi:hypothetical protein AbraIFM66950_010406 [Aspergillus brasiliensis]|nr:hypothetical protein AbraIFM66950_010406 [Aspergillus brasiliensis]